MTLQAPSESASHTGTLPPQITAAGVRCVARSHGFRQSHALVVGVARYRDGFQALRNAADDALAVADRLAKQGYVVTTLIDEHATREALFEQLAHRFPHTISPDDRLTFYFAGHGVALNGNDGPEGFLIPSDASIHELDSYVKMRDLHEALSALSCRHMLAILDCCFAGSFTWSATRNVTLVPTTLYQQQYDRFVRDRAWQVITSAGADQEALDFSVDRRGPSKHSPFAAALLSALDGTALALGGSLVTATKLYVYLRDAIETTKPGTHRQTPGLHPLKKHDKGEYIFQPPNLQVALEPAPPLDLDHNPYRGLKSFDEDHQHLFFGRQRVIAELEVTVECQAFTVVVASSGAGKSSLVKAGLIPRLRTRGWSIASVMRPGEDPQRALHEALDPILRSHSGALSDRIEIWHREHAGELLLIVVDQLEELSSMCRDDLRRQGFLEELAALIERHGSWLRIVATLRSDFESFVRTRWRAGTLPKFAVPRLRLDELRDIIERPAEAKAVFFEAKLIDDILAAVEGQPEALPLLSHVLSELYASCASHDNLARTLTCAAYNELGGVAGSIAKSARAIYDALLEQDARYATSFKNVMLRLIESGPGPLARRRVRTVELEYPDAAENSRVAAVVARLTDARLVLQSSESTGAFVEPAHDALLHEWDLVEHWLDASRKTWDLQRDVAWAAQTWHRGGRTTGQLWVNDPRLPALSKQIVDPDGWLDRLESEFVRKSLQVRRAQRRRLGIVVSGVIVTLAVLALTAWVSRGRATDQLLENRRLLGVSRTDQGRRFVVDEQPLQALSFLAEARSLGVDSVALRSIFATATQQLWTTEIHHTGGVMMAVFSPDGSRFATASYDRTARVWDAVSGQPITPPLLHTGAMSSVRFSADGQRVITSSRDQTANIWDARTGIRTFSYRHPAFVATAEITRDGKWLVTSCDDGFVRAFDATTGAPPGGAPMRHATAIKLAVTSPDSRHVLAADNDGRVKLWDIATGTTVADVEHLNGNSIAFSPAGDRFVTTGGRNGSSKETARVWTATGTLITEVAHEKPINVVRFSPDGQRIVTASNDGTAVVWDVATGKPISREMIHRDSVRAVEFSPDGARLVTGCFDGTARVWDATSGAVLGPPLKHGESVDGVMFSPDGSTILTASADSTARIWRVADGIPLSIATDQLPLSFGVAFSHDGTKVLTAGSRVARVWNAQTGEPVTPALEHPADVRSAVFDTSASHVLTAADDGKVRVWAIATPSVPAHVFALTGGSRAKIATSHIVVAIVAEVAGEHIVVARGTQASVYDATTGEQIAGPIETGATIEKLEFSPNGDRFLTVGGRVVQEWDTHSGVHLRGPWIHHAAVKEAHYASVGDRLLAIAGVEVRVWPTAADGDPIMHRDLISSAAFDPTGTRILTSSHDDTARIWDATTNKPIGLPMQHDGDVWTAAWSPDGTRIVTGSSDETARLWDAETGQPLAPPMRHNGTVGGVWWSPQDERILIAAGDGLAIWDAALDHRPPAMWSAIANRYGAGRPLIPSQLAQLDLGERHALPVATELSRASNLLASALAALPHQVHLAREHATVALNAFRSAHHIADTARSHWVLAVIAAIDGDLAAARREAEVKAPADQPAFVTALAQFAAFELARPELALDILERLPPAGGPGAVDAALIYLAAHRYADAARLANGARSGVVDSRRRVAVEAVAWAAHCLGTDHDQCTAGGALTAAYEQLRDGDVSGERFPALAQALRVDRTTPVATDTVLRVLAILAEPKRATAAAELRSIVTARRR